MSVVGVKMQQITNTSVNANSQNGYKVTSQEEKKENYYETESHIHKQGMFANLNAGAHKLTNDIFTYYPKGFAGSKNSNFYEYLSMGMIPYIGGSATLIAISKAANKFFNFKDASFAQKVGNNMAAGVILYGLGKWVHQKFSRTLIHASTGVPLDKCYINKVVELPEGDQKEGVIRTQYPKIFDSIEFYRNDILKRDGELNHGDSAYFYDKIAKKAGYKEKLNSSEQEMGDKVRKLRARAGALENVNKYIAAATGVAIGAQRAFGEYKIIKSIKPTAIFGNIVHLGKTFVEAVKQLWNPSNQKSIVAKHFGKALLIATMATAVIDWLIPTIGFKTKPQNIVSKIDDKKEYEVG